VLRKKLTLWLGLVISVLFLYLALLNVQFAQIRSALGQVDWGLLFLAAVIFMVSFSVRAVRWSYILRPVRPVGLFSVFSLLSIGFMANNVLPARLGELVRAYFLARKTGIRKSLSLATIVLERLSDFAALLLSALLVTVIFSMPPAVEKIGIAAGLIFAFFIVLLVFVHLREEATLGLFDRLMSLLPANRKEAMMERVNAFVKGLVIIRTASGFLWIFTLSLCVWALWAVALHFTLLAFHIQVPFAARLLILAVVNLGALIPSSPGYVGPYHYLCWVCLSVYGIEKGMAFSFSMVLHALWYVPLTCLGFIMLGKEHLSIAQIRSLEEQVASSGFPMENGGPNGSQPIPDAIGETAHERE